MDWREIYARRLCTPEQAAALIAPGDRIFAGGAGTALKIYNSGK